MITRLLILLGLALVVVDCIDFTVGGLALLGAVAIAIGWWLNRAFGRTREQLAALDAAAAEIRAERAS